MKLIRNCSGITETWIAALRHLYYDRQSRSEYNLVLHIEDINAQSNRSLDILHRFDALLKEQGEYSLNTVADTIFPYQLYIQHGIERLPSIYIDQVFPIIRKTHRNSRGTYALRIFKGINHEGEEVRPLDLLINALRTENNPKGKKHRFEMALSFPGEIPISCNIRSAMGFPCLSHLSFHLDDSRQLLLCTAFYRNHDYYRKTLGNIYGISRLQTAICRAVGLRPGPLTIHSTFAELDNAPLRPLGNFLAEFE